MFTFHFSPELRSFFLLVKMAAYTSLGIFLLTNPLSVNFGTIFDCSLAMRFTEKRCSIAFAGLPLAKRQGLYLFLS